MRLLMSTDRVNYVISNQYMSDEKLVSRCAMVGTVSPMQDKVPSDV